MKFKSLSLASCAALAFLFFAACSSTEEVVEPAISAGAKTVRISITQGDASTRADFGIPAAGIIDGGNPTATALNISTGGHLFFVDEVGTITKYVTILRSGETASDLTVQVGIDALRAGTGEIIEDVPSSSEKVYIYLNLPASVNTAINTASSSNQLVNGVFASVVANRVITASDLADGSGGVTNVPVSGSGNLTAASDPNYGLETTVTLRAVAARIEIPKIKVVSSAGHQITGFKLAGIYVDNFFHQAQLGGLYTAGFVNVNSSATTAEGKRDLFDPSNTGTFYYTAANHADKLFTATDGVDGLGGANATEKTAGNNQAWAYNVFANDQAASAISYLPLAAVNTGTYLPRIIFHFSEVKVDTQPIATNETTYTNQYVTVNGYNDGASSLSFLARGVVYRFDATAGLEISPDDVTPIPGTSTINAKVTATLIPWAVVTVTPEF